MSSLPPCAQIVKDALKAYLGSTTDPAIIQRIHRLTNILYATVILDWTALGVPTDRASTTLLLDALTAYLPQMEENEEELPQDLLRCMMFIQRLQGHLITS